jgi:segregation and condensation protein B
MTWRELWKSTVSNLRVLLGMSPPPAKSPPPKNMPPSPPTPLSSGPAPLVKRKSMPLTGPNHGIPYSERAHAIEAVNQRAAQDAPQTIDLTASRPVLPPNAPLRTRKPVHVPLDVALDEAAFAARHPKAAELPPVVAKSLAAKSLAATDLTWSKQGLAQLEPPTLDLPMLDAPVTDEPQGDPPPSSRDRAGGSHDEADGDETDGEVASYTEHGFGDNGDDEEYDDAYDDDEGVALTTLLESLLFVAAEPVEPRQLAQTLGQTVEVIELGLAELADYYQRSLRGLRVQHFNNKVQLVTAPAAAPFIEAFLNLDNTTRLSSPALETLAVIAYRQPVTRAQIEAVRGVDCAGVLRSLVQRGLVADVGRVEGVGRPILYGVTELFMQHFGLMEMGELPPLKDSEADRLWAATVIEENDPGE